MFTELIENYAQSRNTRHVEGVGFLCSSCWLHKPVGTNLSTGYGVNSETGLLICFECAGKSDIESLKDRTKPFCAYVSSDGKSLTNWPGTTLGRVRDYAEHRTGWHGSIQARFRVIDVHGNWWSGRGMGRGMCCTIRPMKAPK